MLSYVFTVVSDGFVSVSLSGGGAVVSTVSKEDCSGKLGLPQEDVSIRKKSIMHRAKSKKREFLKITPRLNQNEPQNIQYLLTTGIYRFPT